MNKKIQSRQGLTRGPECPECGGQFTPTHNVGHDEDGKMIRARTCRDCDKKFGTVELVLPDEFVFSKTDVTRADKVRRTKRVASFSADRITFWGGIRIVKGKKTNYCASGQHLLLGPNLATDSRGNRFCRECSRIAARKRRFENRDAINAKNRERYRQRKERLSDKDGILPRTASA